MSAGQKSKEQLIKEAQRAAIEKRLTGTSEEASTQKQRAVNKLLKAGTQGGLGQRKWWERQEEEKKDEDDDDEETDIKWKNMEHHGVIFAAEYVAHGIKPVIRGEATSLEVA